MALLADPIPQIEFRRCRRIAYVIMKSAPHFKVASCLVDYSGVYFIGVFNHEFFRWACRHKFFCCIGCSPGEILLNRPGLLLTLQHVPPQICAAIINSAYDFSVNNN